MTNLSKVSVILLNWNGLGDTIQCINSLRKIDYPNFEIIVVDNGSKDNSVSGLRKLKGIKLIENKANLGFAEGNNTGVRKAKGKYIVFLNNDTVVDKNYLASMVKTIESSGNIALVGSKINNLGDFYNRSETKGNLINLLGEPLASEEGKTFMVSGCSMMFRKSIIGEPFDKDYFAYSEDTYVCWLARLKGYDVRIAKDSIVQHKGAKGRSKALNLVEFHGEKNKIMNPLIFYSRMSLLKIVPILLLNVFFTLVISTFKLRAHIRLKSYLWIIWHWKDILRKRRFVQSQRRIADKDLAEYITCKVPYNLAGFEKAVNFLLFCYSWIFRLPVREVYG